MKKNTNHTKGDNNIVIQEVTNSHIHIGDKIYNNPEQYKAHIADLQANLREKGQAIEDLRLSVAELRTDKQYWQQKTVELEKQYQDKTISETDYQAQKAALAQQIQAKNELIAAKDEERNKLLAENLRQSTEINDLQARLDFAEKALTELQAKYKDIDFGKQTETYKKAYDFILAGDVQAADELLSEAYFAAREAKIAEQTKEFYRPLAQEYVLKAQALTANFKWEEAEGYYKKAVEKCPDAEFWFEYAKFSQNQNSIKQAIKYYKQALIQYRTEQDEPKIAAILNNLASLQYTAQQFVEAKKNYQEALIIYRQLEKENSIAYLPDVAATLNNLAALQYANKLFVEAKKNYQEALRIRRELAQENPTTYLPVVAMTLNNLAALQYANSEFDLADANYQEALEIRRKLAKKNTAYLPAVAATLNNLGSLQGYLKQFVEAEESFQEALRIYREIAKKNSAAYLPDVAMTLNNLASLQNDIQQFAAAEKNHQEALSTYRKLAQENPAAYLPDVAMALYNWANLQRVKKQFVVAEKNLQEALEIGRELAQENPTVFDLDYCRTALHMCILYEEYVQQEKLQYVGLANDLLADAAQRLEKYPTIPQAQWQVKNQLIPLQKFFRKYE